MTLVLYSLSVKIWLFVVKPRSIEAFRRAAKPQLYGYTLLNGLLVRYAVGASPPAFGKWFKLPDGA